MDAGKQYYVTDTICKPDSVLVYAPKRLLDTITAAFTEPLRLDDITDTLKLRVPLYAPKGIKFIPSSVETVFPVDIYTEKTVEVPIKGVNFPVDKTLRAFPSKVSVTFQVGLSRFRQVEAEDFQCNVSYEDLLKTGSEKYQVRLNRLPKDVAHIRINPEYVDFLIEQISSYDY